MQQVFCVKKALNKKGEVICKKSLAEAISEIATKLSIHLCRDLGRENYRPGSLTEIKEPEISADGSARVCFRVGIVYCEIKAFF